MLVVAAPVCSRTGGILSKGAQGGAVEDVVCVQAVSPRPVDTGGNGRCNVRAFEMLTLLHASSVNYTLPTLDKDMAWCAQGLVPRECWYLTAAPC